MKQDETETEKGKKCRAEVKSVSEQVKTTLCLYSFSYAIPFVTFKNKTRRYKDSNDTGITKKGLRAQFLWGCTNTYRLE